MRVRYAIAVIGILTISVTVFLAWEPGYHVVAKNCYGEDGVLNSEVEEARWEGVSWKATGTYLEAYNFSDPQLSCLLDGLGTADKVTDAIFMKSREFQASLDKTDFDTFFIGDEGGGRTYGLGFHRDFGLRLLVGSYLNDSG
jgi:hypothetical protein